MSDEYKTRITLICRLADADDSLAWQEFEQYYRRFIYSIINRLNVPEQDSDDLVQEILIRLARSVSDYDRTRAGFRTWLGTICRNCVYNYFEKRNRLYKKQLHLEQQPEEMVLLNASKESNLEELIENEWKSYITSLAMERVKNIFRGNALTVFEKVNEGASFKEISAELGLTGNTANVLHSRVRKRLFSEIKSLVYDLEGRRE